MPCLRCSAQMAAIMLKNIAAVKEVNQSESEPWMHDLQDKWQSGEMPIILGMRLLAEAAGSQNGGYA